MYLIIKIIVVISTYPKWFVLKNNLLSSLNLSNNTEIFTNLPNFKSLCNFKILKDLNIVLNGIREIKSILLFLTKSLLLLLSDSLVI